MNNLNYLFSKYQQPILRLANNKFGKQFLGIGCKDKIVGLTDNAYAIKIGSNKYQASFFTAPVFAERLRYSLIGLDIYREFKKELNLYKELVQGLLCPRVLLTNTPFDSGSGNGVVIYDGFGSGLNFGQVWGQATGTSASNPGGATSDIGVYEYADGNWWFFRCAIPFNTTALGGVTVTAATVTVTPNLIWDDFSTDAKSRIDVVSFAVNDPTSLVVGDYNKAGSTQGATAIDIGSLVIDSQSVFTLNAAGRSYVNTSGWSKLGLTEGHDTDNTAPTGGSGIRQSQLRIYLAANATPAKRPILTVTYPTVGGGAFLLSMI